MDFAALADQFLDAYGLIAVFGIMLLKEIGIPVHLGETPGSIREAAPQLGQHTEEILVDLLGYSWEDIETLRDKGVIL